MDEKNLEYLKKTLNYLGFGTRLNQVLEDAIYKKLSDFSIGLNQRYIPTEFRSDASKGVDQMSYSLLFRKSNTSDAYFLNAVDATLKRYNHSEPIHKRFELDWDHRMSALQCYKLLCGLSLQKDIFLQDLDDVNGKRSKRVSVWFKLDLEVRDKDGAHPLRLFFPEYNFDLKTSFDRYPFINLNDEEKKEAALKALQFGNLISLEMELQGKITQVYLSANPASRSLDVYDAGMVRIREAAIFAKQDIHIDSGQAQAFLNSNQVDHLPEAQNPASRLKR